MIGISLTSKNAFTSPFVECPYSYLMDPFPLSMYIRIVSSYQTTSSFDNLLKTFTWNDFLFHNLIFHLFSAYH